MDVYTCMYFNGTWAYMEVVHSFAAISGSYAPDDTVTLFHPCRRPSGIPGEDYDTAAGAEARTALVPHFEEKYLQVRQ